MRRVAGTLLTLVGAALLIVVVAIQATSALARDRARAEWAAEEARMAVQSAWAPQAGARPTARGAAVGRLVIPSIGLDEVMVEGVEERQLVAGPGHLPGSALPGEKGNAIVSAHRDRHFRALDELQIGDTIVTQTRQHRVRWLVSERRVVTAAAPVLRSTDEARLTLTTCWPVRYLGPAPDRLIITAVALPNVALTATK